MRKIIDSHLNSGLVISLLSCLPSIIYALVNKSKLPEKCASHFNFDNIPDGWMSTLKMWQRVINSYLNEYYNTKN